MPDPLKNSKEKFKEEFISIIYNLVQEMTTSQLSFMTSVLF